MTKTGPYAPSRGDPTSSPLTDSASFKAGRLPDTGSFRRTSEALSAGMASSSTMMAAQRVVAAPEPFDSDSARCRCLVRVLCSPGSDSLEGTHQFLSGYTKGRFRTQIAQRLSVAVYELLANALNYSSMAEEVSVELMDLPDYAAIRVMNETIAPRISMLSEHIAKIRVNAEATLIEEMRRSVAGGPVKPMLGLARVVHEASMQLDVAVQGRRVTLTASCRK
jgi:hypothetical protein